MSCRMQQFSIIFFICTFIVHAASQRNGDVRLLGNDPAIGRLEVFHEEEWKSICFDYKVATHQEGVAQAACRQLGFYNFNDIGNVTKFGLPNDTSTDNKLVVSDCRRTLEPLNAPQHVLRCSPVEGNCEDDADMAISCVTETRGSFPYDTMVDFIHDDPDDNMFLGDSRSEGFVQVYVNERWGPVCNMEIDAAHTFCRQLSYTDAVSVEDMTNTTSLDQEVLEKFQCANSDSACLRDCFDYPRATEEIQCPQGFSYVICTFRTDGDEVLDFYGTRSSCTSSSTNAGVVAGAVVGSLLCVATIAIIAVVVCYLVPGCLFYRGKKGSYSSGLGKTKYDAI